MTFRGIAGSGSEVVNDNYWITSAEGVTTYGQPVITLKKAGNTYLPIIIRY
jgi:hypothetical protein